MNWSQWGSFNGLGRSEGFTLFPIHSRSCDFDALWNWPRLAHSLNRVGKGLLGWKQLKRVVTRMLRQSLFPAPSFAWRAWRSCFGGTQCFDLPIFIGMYFGFIPLIFFLTVSFPVMNASGPWQNDFCWYWYAAFLLTSVFLLASVLRLFRCTTLLRISKVLFQVLQVHFLFMYSSCLATQSSEREAILLQYRGGTLRGKRSSSRWDNLEVR
jgi:hypothetical protein